MKIKEIDNLIMVILYIAFLHASAYAQMVKSYMPFSDAETNYVLIRNIFMLILVLYNLIKKNTLPKLFSNRFNNLWYVFALVVMVSVFPSNVGQGIKLLFVPIVYFIILQYDDDILENISIAAALNGLWILVQSLRVNRVLVGTNYSGIYHNPNTFGASMVVFFVSSFCVCLFIKQRWIKVLFGAFCIISFYYELLSYCRTALLASIAVLFVTFLTYSDKFKSKRRFILVFISVILIGIYILFQFQNVSEFIISHIYKWGASSTDLSSSRLQMWGDVISNPTLLGSVPAFSPHNNFIMVLYQHGIIAGLIFALLIIYAIIKYYFFNKKNESKKALIALLFAVMFVCVGMFEESLGFTGREWMCLGFVGLGYIFKELQNCKTRTGHIRVRLKK